MRTAATTTPLIYALIIALAYAVTAGAYISLSGELVASRATDVETLHRLEIAKGLGFVVVTAAALFAVCLALFRRLAERTVHLERSHRALVEAERQALPGLLAASIAHDFNNLLAVVRWTHEAIAESVHDPDSAEALQEAQTAVGRAEQLARRLQVAGRSVAVKGETPGIVDLARVAESVVELLRHHPAAKRRVLETELEPARLPAAHAELLQQLVTNLVLNALEATRDDGRVVVRVATSGGTCVVEVHDDGPGVRDEVVDHLAEPFFTTKATGTGLGLLSVRMGAQVHGGRLEIGASELGGALFRVTFDAAPAAPASAAGALAPAGHAAR